MMNSFCILFLFGLISLSKCSATIDIHVINTINEWFANEIFIKDPLIVEPYVYNINCDSTRREKCRLSTVSGTINGLLTPYDQDIDIANLGFGSATIKLTYYLKLSIFYPNMTLTNLNQNFTQSFEGITVKNDDSQNKISFILSLNVDQGTESCIQTVELKVYCSMSTFLDDDDCSSSNRYALGDIINPRKTLDYTDPSTNQLYNVMMAAVKKQFDLDESTWKTFCQIFKANATTT